MAAMHKVFYTRKRNLIYFPLFLQPEVNKKEVLILTSNLGILMVFWKESSSFYERDPHDFMKLILMVMWKELSWLDERNTIVTNYYHRNII